MVVYNVDEDTIFIYIIKKSWMDQDMHVDNMQPAS